MNAREGVTLTRSEQIAEYASTAFQRPFPPDILQAAKRALVDVLGVTIGAWDEACVRPVRKVATRWQAQGEAQMFFGPKTTPAIAALVNGSMAHAMDYDDSHQMGAGHISCVCGTTAFAMASHLGANEKQTLAAFITGFEVMARLGGGGPAGVGRSLHRRGLHPTSVFGRVGAAVVASVLMGLTKKQTEYAIGVAATTAGGFVRSFGTHSKPFHGGKAAMDGIMAAELAQEGFISSTQLLELEKGLLDVFIQDRQVEVPAMDFDDHWELKRNGFKPYASCRATHASIQTARQLATQVAGKKITRVHAKVHPNVVIVADNQNPRSALEHKFSVRYCMAMGLTGYRLVASDFTENLLLDKALAKIAAVTELEVIANQPQYEAHVDVYVEGEAAPLHADTFVVLGHADNPMSEQEVWSKFDGLVSPVLGQDKTKALFDWVNQLEQPGNLKKIQSILVPSSLSGNT
ncbi:MAG: MmgE/PrpD family protein [Betaproteobacteria bacterium]